MAATKTSINDRKEDADAPLEPFRIRVTLAHGKNTFKTSLLVWTCGPQDAVYLPEAVMTSLGPVTLTVQDTAGKDHVIAVPFVTKPPIDQFPWSTAIVHGTIASGLLEKEFKTVLFSRGSVLLQACADGK